MGKSLTSRFRPRFRVVSIAVAATLIAGTLALAPAGSAGGHRARLHGMKSPDRIKGTFLVTLRRDAVSVKSVKDIAAKAGGRRGALMKHIGVVVFRGTDAAAAKLATDPRVRAIEADENGELAGDFDPDAAKTTPGVRRHRLRHSNGAIATAHGSGLTGAGVNIANIDTGVDLDHQEFAGRIVDQDTSDGDIDTARCDKTGALTKGPLEGKDTDGHGTRTSGTAAAAGIAVVGAAPGAGIGAIRSSVKKSAVACAMNYVATMNSDGLPATPAFPIVTTSIVFKDKLAADACGRADAIAVAVCALFNSLPSKVFITAAAGNNNGGVANTGPAKFTQVNAVSAECERNPDVPATLGEPQTGIADPNRDGLASFTNFGAKIAVAAAGCKVFAPTLGGTADYTKVFGTSNSAPAVAGTAALLKAANPALTVAAILTAIQTGGFCPNNTRNSDGGNCNAPQGQWDRVKYTDFTLSATPDKDAIAEPLLNAYCAGVAAAVLVADLVNCPL